MHFSNPRPDFNFHTLSSVLAMIHAINKSYRSASFAHSMNLLNAIPLLLRGQLAISLIPLNSLVAILEIVAIQQSKGADRISFTFSGTNRLSYYVFRSLAIVIRVPEGLLLTLSIPLVSRETVFTLFEAKVILMLGPNDPQAALVWSIQAPYLAISEDQKEYFFLSSVQFQHFLGSSKYRICSKLS